MPARGSNVLLGTKSSHPLEQGFVRMPLAVFERITISAEGGRFVGLIFVLSVSERENRQGH